MFRKQRAFSLSVRSRKMVQCSASGHDDTTQAAPPLIVDGRPIRSVMAPMVSAGDYAFRRLVRSYGCDLCFTQMMHARNLMHDATFRKCHLDFVHGWDHPSALLQAQQTCIQDMTIQKQITNHHEEGGPLIVQLAGNDPSLVVEAAHMILSKTECGNKSFISGFDLNLGCPQAIARKGRYGAFLVEEDEDLVCRILCRMRQELPPHVLVSAKIRLPASLDDPTRTVDDEEILNRRIEKLVCHGGIDFLTVHGRTLHQNKITVGSCRLDAMRMVVEAAQRCRGGDGFPVIANGGIQDRASIPHVLQQTGASAIMSSEALLETPNLFAKTSTMGFHYDDDDDLHNRRALLEQQIGFARDYIALASRYPPVPGVLGRSGSFAVVKGHLFKFLHRFIQAHTDLRDRLSENGASRIRHLGQALRLVDELESRYQDDRSLLDSQSFQPESSWYRRFRGSKSLAVSKQIALAATEKNERTVEERKREMQQRIQQLRKQRLSKKDQKVAA